MDFPEEMDATDGLIREIPLFPLDLVLFPNMVLPLHIYEERYKTMIQRCLSEKIPFGILRVTGEDAISGGVETSRVGTYARIIHVERLPDGRMNIQTVGIGRFRLLETHEIHPYRTGIVEPLSDFVADDRAAERLCERVQPLLAEYLALQLTLMGQSPGQFELPDEAQPLSFAASFLLPLENEARQALLEETDTLRRLETVRRVLDDTLPALKQQVKDAGERQVEWRPLTLDRFDGKISKN